MSILDGRERLSDWDIDLAKGLQAEDNLAALLGLSGAKVELKNESFLRSANLFVEYAQKPQGQDWKPSGIQVTKADYWVHQFGHAIYIYPTFLIKAAVEALWEQTELHREVRSDNPTRGILINRDWLQFEQENIT